MANENQNLTNPNDLVDVRLLDYFKDKIDTLIDDRVANGYVRAHFVDTTLVFSKGGAFAGTKLVIGRN
jgi:hypothetical protein